MALNDYWAVSVPKVKGRNHVLRMQGGRHGGGRGRVPGGRGGDHNRQWNNPHWGSNVPSAEFQATLKPVGDRQGGLHSLDT